MLKEKTNNLQSLSTANIALFNNERVKLALIPLVTASYYLEMNHVDRGDQLLSYYGYIYVLCRGPWQALSQTFVLLIVRMNSFILQLYSQPSWKKKTLQKDWRQVMSETIFQQFSKTSNSRKRFRTGDEFTAISEHKLINRGKKSDCLVCQGYRIGQIRKRRSLLALSPNIKRSQTRWGCRECDVALCNSQDCWYKYHHTNQV